MRLVALLYSTAIVALAAFILFCGWLDCKLFEFVLWCFFAVDVPWYLDFCGALFLNGANLVLALIAAIAYVAGAPVPFIHLH